MIKFGSFVVVAAAGAWTSSLLLFTTVFANQTYSATASTLSSSSSSNTIIESPEHFQRALIASAGHSAGHASNGGILPGDGKCNKEDLDDETLKDAKEFQTWFVDTYLDGNHSKLKTDEKLNGVYELFDEYVDPFKGIILEDGIDQMANDLGMNLDWLKFFLECLYQDHGLDENEFIKAVCVGEPHFTTWQGANFDYHGACDLVLIHNPSFDEGNGLDLHVRTEQIESGVYSFVSDAALRLGNDIFEVRKNGSLLLNHKEGRFTEDSEEQLITVGGFPAMIQSSDKCFTIGPIEHKCVPSKTVSINLGAAVGQIVFKIFNNMVHVEVSGHPQILANGSSGLMGTYPFERHGRVARDGRTLIHDSDEFGQEWQVRDDGTDMTLFTEKRYPQFPQTCIPPSENHAAVRYLRSTKEERNKLQERAMIACTRVLKNDKNSKNLKSCIFDVMATDDETNAMLYGPW